MVIADATHQLVITSAAGKEVVACASIDRVVSCATVHVVNTACADDAVRKHRAMVVGLNDVFAAVEVT